MTQDSPDANDIKEVYNERVREFKAKEISEAVFRAHLVKLGFRGQDIDAEVNLHKGDY